MNVLQPNTQGVNLEDLQTRRFTETLHQILGAEPKVKMHISHKLVQAAKVTIEQVLSNAQLNHLCNFADSWNLDHSIGRSGAGLKIEFKLRK